MVNPIKSLFYQYYWWQASIGHKDMPAEMAMLFMSLLSMFIISAVTIYLNYFYLKMSSDFILTVSLGGYVVCLILGYFTFLYKKKYVKIITDNRYDTILEGIGPVLFFVFSLGSLILSFYLIGAFDDLK